MLKYSRGTSQSEEKDIHPKRKLMGNAAVPASSEMLRKAQIRPTISATQFRRIGSNRFGWLGTPGVGGVTSEAVEYVHGNTTLASAQLHSEGADMMAHVNAVDPWEEGNPTPVTAEAKIRAPGGGESLTPPSQVTWITTYNLRSVCRRRHDRANRRGLTRR